MYSSTPEILRFHPIPSLLFLYSLFEYKKWLKYVGCLFNSFMGLSAVLQRNAQKIVIKNVETVIFPLGNFWDWLEKKGICKILPRISMIATVGFHMFLTVSCWLDKQELSLE